jgi:hypothetical protein
MDHVESSTASEVEQWQSLPQEHMARSTKLPWYSQRLEHKLTPSFRQLLQEWSGIAPEDVVSHIYRSVSSIDAKSYAVLTMATARRVLESLPLAMYRGVLVHRARPAAASRLRHNPCALAGRR